MSDDIYGYNRTGQPDAVLDPGEASLQFGGTDAAEYMIQDWQVAYRQDVEELFELGSDRLYWVRGRAQGQGNIQRIIGMKGFSKFFPDNAYDVCEGGAPATISAAGGACFPSAGTTESTEISLAGVVVVDVGFQSSVQGASVIRGNIGFKFAKMGL